jgi:hypothetical protein
LPTRVDNRANNGTTPIKKEPTMPKPRHRTTHPQSVKDRERAAAQEPISLRARISTLEITNQRLATQLQTVRADVEAKAVKDRAALEDEVRVCNALMMEQPGILARMAAEAIRSAVEPLFVPRISAAIETANRAAVEAIELREDRDRLLKMLGASHAQYEASKTIAATAIEESSRAKMALADLLRDGVAPLWLLRMAKVVAESPEGKAKDAAATEFFRRCMRWAAEQMREAKRDVQEVLRVSRGTAADADAFAAGAKANGLRETDEQRAVIRAKADTLGIFLHNSVAEIWWLMWVADGVEIDRLEVSGSPSMVAEKIQPLVEAAKYTVVDCNGVGVVLFECLSASLPRALIERHTGEFPSAERLALPGCGHRKMAHPFDCDDTACAGRPEEQPPTVCPNLKPRVIDGKPMPPDGCSHYRWLVAREAEAETAPAKEPQAANAPTGLDEVARHLLVVVTGPQSFGVCWLPEGSSNRLATTNLDDYAMQDVVDYLSDEVRRNPRISIVSIEASGMGIVLAKALQKATAYRGAGLFVHAVPITSATRERAKTRILGHHWDDALGVLVTDTAPIDNPDDFDVLMAGIGEFVGASLAKGRKLEVVSGSDAQADADDGAESFNDSDGDANPAKPGCYTTEPVDKATCQCVGEECDGCAALSAPDGPPVDVADPFAGANGARVEAEPETGSTAASEV